MTCGFMWLATLQFELARRRKTKFRPYIRKYISPHENFEYSYPLSGLSVLLHGVISLPEATSYDKNKYTCLAMDVRNIANE